MTINFGVKLNKKKPPRIVVLRNTYNAKGKEIKQSLGTLPYDLNEAKKAFQGTLDEYEQYQLENYIENLKKAELRALQAQINPHFLYNTLDAIIWMAEAKKWAPGLKTLRFHGPVKERSRLKRIAVGEIDMMGNPTVKQKNKLKKLNLS